MDKKENKNKPKFLVVKILCFIISFMLWIYVFITLNPVLTTKVYNIPVNIINSLSLKKNGLIVLPNQKFTVNLTVEGKASDIYNLNQDNFEIFLDLSLYELDKGENIVRSYIRSIPQNITVAKPSDLDIKILIDEFVEKRVPVDKLIEKHNTQGFYSFEPIITPEYVIVSGASKFVNEVDKAFVVARFDDLKQDTYQNLKVKFLSRDGKEINEFLDIYPDVVEMYIMVRAMKDVEVDVPFINNIPEGYKLESIDIIPKQIKIIGTEDSISNIYKVSSDNVDLSKITENSILEVPLKISSGIETVDNKKSVTVKVKVSKISE